MGVHVKNCFTCEYFAASNHTRQFAANRVAGIKIKWKCTRQPRDYEFDDEYRNLEYLTERCGDYKFGKLQADAYLKRGIHSVPNI